MSTYQVFKETLLKDPSTFSVTKTMIEQLDKLDVVDVLNILEVLNDLFDSKFREAL